MLKFIESDPWLFAIITGVIGSLLWTVLARTTQWAKAATKSLGRGVLAVLRWIFSIRVTTEPRIRRRIERALEAARHPAQNVKFWQWVRDPRPGHWRLENHTGEACTVIEIEFDTDAGWTWRTYPNFPVRLRDGESLDLHGSISVPTFAPFMSDNPGATVRWADSHHDEDVIWAPFEDGLKFA